MTIVSLLGALIGVVMGFTGAGGGILAVPALVAGLGWSMQQAAPVALIAVACGAALGALQGLRHQLVRYRAAILMALAGLPFTSLGVMFAHRVSQQWLMGLFAGVMLIVAVRLFRQANSGADHNPEAALTALGRINPATGRFDWSLPTALLLASIGALTGLMAGLLGVGGGFVLVPMLRRFTNLSMPGVVATSLLVIALVSSAGVANALAHGAEPPAAATALFTAATLAGMLGGRRLAARLPAHHVQQGFALLLMIVAAGMLAKMAAFI